MNECLEKNNTCVLTLVLAVTNSSQRPYFLDSYSTLIWPQSWFDLNSLRTSIWMRWSRL